MNKYYTSKEDYEKWHSNSIYRKKCIDLSLDILECPAGAPVPSYLFKKIKEYEEIGYESLYNTLVSVGESVRYQLRNKNIQSNITRINYLMAACSNRVAEEYKKIVAAKKSSAVDQKITDSNDKDVINKKQKVKDIRKWLTEEEYA